MEATNIVAIANETESESEKRAGLVRMEALNARTKALAETMGITVTRVRELAFLNFEARNMKPSPKIVEHIAAFDEMYPHGSRSEWDAKLTELDAAVVEANKTGNATLIAFATSTRAKEIKRHDAQIVNAKKAADSRKSKKASEVVTTMLYDNAPEYAIA